MQLDVIFTDLDEWLSWSETHPDLLTADVSSNIVSNVMKSGFDEPLTGRYVGPSEIALNSNNWREDIVSRGLNSRNRAVLKLIEEHFANQNKNEVTIFATEAVTSFALVLRGVYPRFIGSEYGFDEAARERLFPIVHQDLLKLSLPSERFDLVTTNEVLEHVPDIDVALSEIVRVLKPGGWHIGTHPFRFMDLVGDVRTRLHNDQLVFLKEPERHGNPVDPDRGSLVFETPGWDILERARRAGFSTAHMRFVASEKHGFVTSNTGVFVLCAQK